MRIKSSNILHLPYSHDPLSSPSSAIISSFSIYDHENAIYRPFSHDRYILHSYLHDRAHLEALSPDLRVAHILLCHVPLEAQMVLLHPYASFLPSFLIQEFVSDHFPTYKLLTSIMGSYSLFSIVKRHEVTRYFTNCLVGTHADCILEIGIHFIFSTESSWKLRVL
jgi:hypothetical protein